MKDQGYRLLSLGPEAGAFLDVKRQRLSPASFRDYESCLDKLARHFDRAELAEFDSQGAPELIEGFLAARWGKRSARTFNKNLSVVHGFFEWQVRRGKLRADPTLMIERVRPHAVHRTTFTDAQREAIIAANPDHRDRIALRLLLDYGVRKGALREVRFEHFDQERHRLVLFTKGSKVLRIPLPGAALWVDMEALVASDLAVPDHYLLPRQRVSTRSLSPPARRSAEKAGGGIAESLEAARDLVERLGSPDAEALVEKLEDARTWLARASERRLVVRRWPAERIGEHGAHSWWYRCLARAEIVAPGTTAGERMHKARHTAGQRVLDKTGNLKAVQKMLGHSSFNTTANEYLDWGIERLEETLREVVDVVDVPA